MSSGSGPIQYPTTSLLVTVKDNKIKRFPLNGIVLETAGGFEAGTYGTLTLSAISGNRLEDNGNVGILVQYADASTQTNSSNQLFLNEAEDNHVNDCEDDTATYGTLTAETYNTWIKNIGSTSTPNGLCSPGGWH